MGQVIYVDFAARHLAKRGLTASELIEMAIPIDETPDKLLEAQKLYEQALRLEPNNATALNNLGNVYVRLSDLDAAANCYTKAVRTDPKEPTAHYNLGWVHLDLGRHHQATECLSAAVKLRPDFADAHYNLAMAYFRLGKTTHANRHFRRYIKLEPEGFGPTWPSVT